MRHGRHNGVVREIGRQVNRARAFAGYKGNARQVAGVSREGRRGRRHLSRLALGRIPSDAGDIRPRDADIGQFTVAHGIQFAQVVIEPAPGAECSNNGRK